MVSIARLIVVILLTCGVIHCAPTSKVVSVPERLEGQGLVVAAVAADALVGPALAPRRYGNDPPTFTLAYIDGMEHMSPFKGNYLVVPLAPGVHELNSLKGPSPVRSTAGATSMLTVPVNIKFTVEEGRITNLGLLVIVPESLAGRAATGDRFYTIRLNNNTEMVRHIKNRYPTVFSTLKNTEPLFVSAKDLGPKDIRLLRGTLLGSPYNLTLVSRNGQYRYVVGEVGLIAALKTDASGKLKQYKILDTNTLSRFSACGVLSDGIACAAKDGNFLAVRGEDVSAGTPPMNDGFASYVHALPNDVIVIPDRKMNIYISHDRGRTWHRDSNVSEPRKYEPAYWFENGKEGVYVLHGSGSSFGGESSILAYSRYDKIQFRKIVFPDSGDFAEVHETSKGLLVGPASQWQKDRRGFFNYMVFKRNGESAWKHIDLGSDVCVSFERTGEGSRLKLICAGRDLVSDDGGETWKKDTWEVRGK